MLRQTNTLPILFQFTSSNGWLMLPLALWFNLFNWFYTLNFLSYFIINPIPQVSDFYWRGFLLYGLQYKCTPVFHTGQWKSTNSIVLIRFQLLCDSSNWLSCNLTFLSCEAWPPAGPPKIFSLGICKLSPCVITEGLPQRVCAVPWKSYSILCSMHIDF